MQIRFQTSCFPARKQELWWIHRRIDTGEAGPKHGVRGTPGGGLPYETDGDARRLA